MADSALSRQLMIFHLLRFTGELQYKDILDAFPVNKKTAARDLQFLAHAGVARLRYSRRTMSFLPAGAEFVPRRASDFHPPAFPPGSEPAKAHLERFVRLCTMMLELDQDPEGPGRDPALWYQTRYPALSRRTRERDFAQLREIGYGIAWREAWELEPDDPDYSDTGAREDTKRHRRCFFPHSLEDVEAFRLRL